MEGCTLICSPNGSRSVTSLAAVTHSVTHRLRDREGPSARSLLLVAPSVAVSV